MPTGNSIDHDTFHGFLFRRADRKGRLRMDQKVLAAEFGLTKFTLSRTITKMIEDKRLRKISRKGNNRGYFVVEDPELWKAAYGDE